MAGCWYMRVTGSGTFLPVGRSLRARTRLEMGIGLQLHTLNSTELNARNRRTGHLMPWTWENVRAETEQFPSMIEGRLNLCEHARRLGYDTIQLGDDQHCKNASESRGRPSYAEIITCHDACIALPLRKARPTACVPGLPMRTGLRGQLECLCDASRKLSNCDLTSKQLPSALVSSSLGQSIASKLAVSHPECQTCM